MLIKKLPRYSSRDTRIINKYLNLYSEPEAQWSGSELAEFTDSGYHWDHVVTVPACGEDAYLPGLLQSISDCKLTESDEHVLCIVILNGNVSREAEYAESNRRSRAWFEENCAEIFTLVGVADGCPQSLLSWKSLHVLLVDRSQSPWLVPSDQGVGLVRKIVADLALMLITAGIVRSRWIQATDADARVPEDYFQQLGHMLENDKSALDTSCCIYPYKHIPDNKMPVEEHQRYWPAVVQYELWLRYYVSGLSWAGSPYAYPSVGSLLAFDALAYARVRGFPRRMAGEDFYFQNKLNKIGTMSMISGNAIELLTRPSTRVPFGTGQGTIKADRLQEQGKEYIVYHPRVFCFLKSFHLAAVAWLKSTIDTSEDRQQAFFYNMREFKEGHVHNISKPETWMLNLFDDMQLFKNLEDAENRSRTTEGAIRQFNDWFDGFRTLKLIHYLRDRIFGSLPLAEALQVAVFLEKGQQSANADIPTEAWLEFMRGL